MFVCDGGFSAAQTESDCATLAARVGFQASQSSSDPGAPFALRASPNPLSRLAWGLSAPSPASLNMPLLPEYSSSACQPEKRSDGERQVQVGKRVSITLHTGRMVDGTVRAIVGRTDGNRLQVNYGTDESALVELWRVHRR